jgi:hypothetical protein
MSRPVVVNFVGDSSKLDRTINKVDKNVEGFGSKIKKVLGPAMLGVGVVAGAAIAKVGIDAVKAAAESNAVSKETETRIRQMGNASKITAKEVGDLATAISNKTGIDDEAVQSGANMLLTFQNIRNEVGKGNDIFNKATQVVTDFSVKFGVDTSKAAITVGKALNDPIKGITSLTRVGVTFTDQQKKQIEQMVKVGDIAGAQKVILAELGKQTAGAAAASTTAWDKLLGKLGNIQEQVGNVLLPIVSKLAEFLSIVIPKAITVASRAWEIFKGAFTSGDITRGGPVGVLQGIGVAAKKAGDGIGLAKRVWDAFSQSFRTGEKMVQTEDGTWVPESFYTGKKPKQTGFFGGVARVGLAAKELTTTIQKKFDEFKPNLAAFGKHLVDGMKKLGQPIIAGIIVGVQTGNWEPLGKALAGALVEALKGAGNLSTSIMSWVKDQFSKINWLQLGKDAAKYGVPFAIGFVTNFVGEIVDYAISHPMDMLKFILAIIPIGKASGIIAKLLKRIPFLRAFAPLFEGIGNMTKPLTDAVGKLLGAMGRHFLKGLGLEGAQMGRRVSRLFDGLRLNIWNKREQFARAALGLIEGLGRGIRSGLGIIGRAIATVIRFLLGPFRPAAGWLISAGLNLVRGLRAGIAIGARAVGGVLRGLKDAIVGGIKRLFGIKSPSTVMQGIGSNLIGGLVKGLVTNTKNLRGVIKSLGVSTRDLLGAALGGAWEFVKGKWQSITSFVGGIFTGGGSLASWVRQAMSAR